MIDILIVEKIGPSYVADEKLIYLTCCHDNSTINFFAPHVSRKGKKVTNERVDTLYIY